MSLDPAVEKELKYFAMPAAWAFHDDLPEEKQVDLAYAVSRGGDRRLVAAEVLDVACFELRERLKEDTTQATKRYKLGPLELEKFAPATGVADADAWCARAKWLREQVMQTAQSERKFGPPLAGFVVGSINQDPIIDPLRRRFPLDRDA